MGKDPIYFSAYFSHSAASSTSLNWIPSSIAKLCQWVSKTTVHAHNLITLWGRWACSTPSVLCVCWSELAQSLCHILTQSVNPSRSHLETPHCCSASLGAVSWLGNGQLWGTDKRNWPCVIIFELYSSYAKLSKECCAFEQVVNGRWIYLFVLTFHSMLDTQTQIIISHVISCHLSNQWLC